METGVAGSTIGGAGVSQLEKYMRLQVAQQVLDGGDQGGTVGATTASVRAKADSVGAAVDAVGATAGSDNDEVGGAGSMSFGVDSWNAIGGRTQAEATGRRAKRRWGG
jgi:hypothetical protein